MIQDTPSPELPLQVTAAVTAHGLAPSVGKGAATSGIRGILGREGEVQKT